MSSNLRAARDPAATGAGRRRRGVTTVAAAAVAALLATTTGCGSMSERERDTARGAAGGAAAGAVLGRATGGDTARGAAIGAAIGAVVGNLWSKRQDERRTSLQGSAGSLGATVDRTPENALRLRMPGDTAFDPGASALRPSARPLLDELARTLDPNTRVVVVGHADASTTSTQAETMSLQRAQAVRAYLMTRGVDATHIEARGEGARQPIADNTTEAGRASNRRIEIYVTEAPVG